MFLQEPAPSRFDLQFHLFRFPVRVAWGFWVAAVVLGWEFAQMLDFILMRGNVGSPGPAGLLIVWVAAMFISILVHELGHALAMRFYGGDARIVLYHFGGLAIPNIGAWNAARRRYSNTPQTQIVISFAGPAAQFLLAMFVWAVAIAVRMPNTFSRWVGSIVDLPIADPLPVESPIPFAFVECLVLPSMFWVVMNLLPVLPLDGGNIMINLMRMWGRGDTDRTAYAISMTVAGLAAFWGFQSGQTGLGLMYVSLLVGNYQMLQSRGQGMW